MLELVGLNGAKNKKVKDFSTGMKQRLGLGIALLHDPDILILDEPTNGLDPIGINNLRLLLLDLKAQGKTILLSSHILSEVEKLVDHIGIINKGEMIYQGTLAHLQEVTSKNITIRITTNNPEQAHKVLSPEYPCDIENEVLNVQIESSRQINAIVSQLINQDIELRQLIQPKMNLEGIFMTLTRSTTSKSNK